MRRIEIVLRQMERNTVSETILAAFEDSDPQLVEQSDSKIMTFPGLTISLNEQIVYRNGEAIVLTKKEFCTLVFLAQHPKWIQTAEQIYEAVWREDGENCGNSVSKIIGQLRRKLTPDTPQSGYIQTIAGRGYKFEIAEQTVDTNRES